MIPRMIFIPAVLALTALGTAVRSQDNLTIRITPASLTLKVGEETQLKAEVLDQSGRTVEADVLFFSGNRRQLRVEPDGKVTAIAAGEYVVTARVATAADAAAGVRGRRGANSGGGPTARINVTVPEPALTNIEFANLSGPIYVGITTPLRMKITDETGSEREDVSISFTSSETRIAAVDGFGQLTGTAPGRSVLRASAENLTANFDVEVLANPVRSIDISADLETPRTGDVVHFTVMGKDGSGNAAPNVPVHLSVQAQPDDGLGEPASGQIKQDGRFVAETPGLYTIIATCGDTMSRKTIRATARNIGQTLEVVGHGRVPEVHTSDLWVWEGVDGKDYAVTGTWGVTAAAGFEDGAKAYFWDVTDPANMKKIGSIQVDARTVNDVKVSEDGRICVISREGASNRRNGIVLIDVVDPSNPSIISTYDDELTGGVHNLYIADEHVYALSAGQRYDIINIEDPRSPVKVGSFRVDAPNASIHDVWVEDGLAYSSNWRHGVQVVDVGNGKAGGRPDNPVWIGSYAYPSGRNHAAFPFKSQSVDKFYVIAGDETFPYGMSQTGPTYPRGYMHFIDFTDMENPEEIARYQVPEAGTHNLWVEGDILYAAYYNGGIRVVDISGELMGDLYRQGREIAWFIPTDPEGYIPNAAMTWGPQPYKGNIFLADHNSGLWCVKLVPETRGR